MEQLKAAIGHTHRRVEAQALTVEAHGRQLNEQAAMNVKISKDFADIRGDLTQHKFCHESYNAEIRAAVSGPGLCT